MQAESPYGSHARAKTFLEMLAAFLQTPESFSRHLQRLCKRQKVFRGLCSIPANSRKFFEAFAAFLQTPKSFSRPLQRSCKLQKVFRETCNSVANAKKFFVGLATVLQTFPKTLWLSQCAIQDILQKEGTSFFRRTHVQLELRISRATSARKSFLLLLRAQGPQGLYVFM